MKTVWLGKGLIGESRTHVDKAVEGTRVIGVADRRWGITVGGFEGAILDEFNRGYTRSPTRSRIHDQECLASRPSSIDLKAKHLVEYQITRRRAKAAGGTINREGSHDDPNVGPYELSFLGLSSPGS